MWFLIPEPLTLVIAVNYFSHLPIQDRKETYEINHSITYIQF